MGLALTRDFALRFAKCKRPTRDALPNFVTYSEESVNIVRQPDYMFVTE
jgi:hypothetical protein